MDEDVTLQLLGNFKPKKYKKLIRAGKKVEFLGCRNDDEVKDLYKEKISLRRAGSQNKLLLNWTTGQCRVSLKTGHGGLNQKKTKIVDRRPFTRVTSILLNHLNGLHCYREGGSACG